MFRRFRLRLRALFRRDDTRDEIALHFEQLVDELTAQGLNPREARLAAARQFGNVTAIQEQSRELFSFRLLADLVRDLGYAGRVLRRAPLFFAGSAFVLALGIGANCAVFNVVYSVLLKPLPYEQPDRVAMVWSGTIRRHGRLQPAFATGRRVLSWRARAPGVFSDLAVTKLWDGNLGAQFDLVMRDRAERLRGGLVTPNFFSVLGTHAAVGRVFSPSGNASGHDDLVVLSYGLWERAFGSDPGIVGRPVTLISGRGKHRAPREHTVIGVLPRDFRYTYPLETEVWAINSWRNIEADHPDAIEYDGAVARLAPGVSVQAANGKLASPRNADTRYPDTRVQLVTDWVEGEARPSILLIAGVSLLLLLIACATVANGLLVRLTQRKRELAVRASLGAGRGRILRQLLTEGFVLSLAGAAGGLLLASGLVPIFRAIVPGSMARADEMAVEPWLLLLPAAAATAITVLAMLAPAVQGSDLNTAEALRSSGGTPSAARWRFLLVTIQTAVATSLLVGATLLLTSFWRISHVDLGFDGTRVWTAEMRLLNPTDFVPGRIARFQQEVLERVRALPGVRDAGITSAVPFRGVDWLRVVRPAGKPKEYVANERQVTPGYFSAMRMVLLRGRLVTDRDTATSEPVVVISDLFAQRAFPGEDPIGKQLGSDPARTIVGVVKDVRYQSMDTAPAPAIYIPAVQDPSELTCLVFRSAEDPKTIPGTLRRVVREVDPTVPVEDVTTVDRIVSDSVADRRFYTLTIAAFALLALVITASGLIVVIARSVAERRRELAIRAAMGAQSRELVGMVMRQGLAAVLLGTTTGLLGAWVAARVLERFLFGVKLHDPAVYLAAGVFTVAIAVVACFVPARRIGKLAPAGALQSE